MQVSSTSLLDYAITREYYASAAQHLAAPVSGVTPYSYVPNTPSPVHQNVIVALKAKLNGQHKVKEYSDPCFPDDSLENDDSIDDENDDADSTHSYPIKCSF